MIKHDLGFCKVTIDEDLKSIAISGTGDFTNPGFHIEVWDGKIFIAEAPGLEIYGSNVKAIDCKIDATSCVVSGRENAYNEK